MWMNEYLRDTLIREQIAHGRSHTVAGTQAVLTPEVTEFRRHPAPKPAAARTRLLLEGPIVSTLLRLGAPNMIVNVVLIAVTAGVDAHFAGRLGPSALAGLTLVFPLIMLMQQMANGSMGGAIASAIARAIGAGRRDDACALVVHGLVIAGGMAAVFTTAALVAGPIFYRLMGGRGEVLAAAAECSTVIFAGALAYWVLGALTSSVRGAGHASVLAGVYVGAEVLHVLLVPVLVFGLGPVPALGITGAAVATVTSVTVSAIVLGWYLRSGRTVLTLSIREIRLSRRLFVEILRVGAPASLVPVLGNVTLAILTGFVATLGPAALAGFGVAVRLEYVQVPLTFGLGVGVLAMVGTNIGAGQLTRAARITWTAVGLAVAATGAIGVVVLAWPALWTSFFTSDAAVHAAAAAYLPVVALTYPFLGLGFLVSYAFQAAGRPWWPLLSASSRALLVAGGGWIAIRLLDGGLGSLALVAASGLFFYGSTLAIAFRTGAWRPRLRVTSRAAAAVVVATLLGTASGAAADEIKVLSAAAMQSIFKEIAGDFERASGHRLVIAYGTIGGITQRVLDGETADYIIGSTLSMPTLAKQGRIEPASQVTIASVGVGLVVPSGTPKPPLASVDDVRRALVAATVLVYADPVRGGAAGVHVGRVIQKLGIADQLKSQITLAAGGDVTEVTLAQGKGALGLTQISEILGKAGAEFVGPMPAELQNYTVFVGGTPAGAKPSEAVTAFVAFLKTPRAIAVMRAKGLEVN